MDFDKVNNNRMTLPKGTNFSNDTLDSDDEPDPINNPFLPQDEEHSPAKKRPMFSFDQNSSLFSKSTTNPIFGGSPFVFSSSNQAQQNNNPFLKYKVQESNKGSGILSYLNGNRTPEKVENRNLLFLGEDSPETKKRKKLIEDAGIKRCLLCDEKFQGRSAAMAKTQHMIIIHFKDKLSADKIAKKENGSEYNCPIAECGFKSKLEFNWAIHYGTVHGMIRKLEIEFLRERSKQREEEAS